MSYSIIDFRYKAMVLVLIGRFNNPSFRGIVCWQFSGLTTDMSEYASKRFHQRRRLGQPLMLERWDPGSERGENIHVEVQGIDISSGGIGIAVFHTLQVGEVVKAEYPLNGDGVTLPIYTEVIWCSADNGSSRAGLRFLM